MGTARTGKTSFLRALLYENNLNALITYDESVMQTDEMFVNFLTDSDNDMMIVEDADLMLGSRERDGNDLMSRYLNVSDGLIKFPRKKMVFTTNLNEINKIDEALLREGRCFDKMYFRALTYSETIAAAEKIGIEPPQVERDYTLAELFNQKKAKREKQPRIGFAA
jgi:hypothetical protein